MSNAVFSGNADFLRTAMSFIDACIGRAMQSRAGGFDLPRGLVVSADLAHEALKLQPLKSGELTKLWEELNLRVERTPVVLPLPVLCDLMELSPFARFCALVALSSAYDRKYELLYGYLNDNIQQNEPNLGCAVALYSLFAEVEEGEIASFFADDLSGNAYLFEAPVEVGLKAQLRLCGMARLIALGGEGMPRELEGLAEMLQPEEVTLDYGLEAHRLPQLLDAVLESATNQVVQLIGDVGSGRKTLLKRYAQDNGLRVLRVDAERAIEVAQEMRELAKTLTGASLMNGALLLLDNADVKNIDENKRTVLLRELRRRQKVTLLSVGKLLTLPEGITNVSVEFLLPGAQDSRKLWAQELMQYPLAEDISAAVLADKYAMTPGRVRDTLQRAALQSILAGEESLTQKRISQAVRDSATHRMDGQAKRINAFYTWDDLVVDENTERELRLFCGRVRGRIKVMEEWGFKKKLAYGKAVSALFYGVPGTGKTMAAQVIASDLNMDLYRVDLSQIMNKYIGETEKNLGRIFDEAQNLSGILFFDEADALFAKRTDVSDSKDKYSNAETAFLLQKIEEFDGLVILATNLAYNFDDAFKRRINYMVNFTMPNASQRRMLWEKVFPEEVRAEERIDLDFLAESFEITGSTIKSIALSAAYMAADAGEEICMPHIIRALKHEFAKSGSILIKSKLREYDVE